MKRRRYAAVWGVAAGAMVAVGVSASAVAQEGGARGHRVGAFTGQPSVTTSVSWQDNVFAQADQERADVIYAIDARYTLQPAWSRHHLGGFLQARAQQYADFDTESRTDFGAGADGRLDVTSRTSVGANVAGYRATEPRTSSSSPANAAEPINFDRLVVGADLSHAFNRMSLTGAVGYEDYAYSAGTQLDGSPLPQNYRDRDLYTVSGRVAVEVTPTTAVFLQAAANTHDYRLDPSMTDINRNSDGRQVLFGAQFDITNLIQGDFGLGYFTQEFDDPSLASVDGLAANGSINWSVTGLTTLTFGAERRFNDTALTGASGLVGTLAYAQVQHDLLRSLALRGRLDVAADEFEGDVDRKDERFGVGVGASFAVNQSVSIDFDASQTRQESSGQAGTAVTGGDYDIQRASLALRASF